MFTVNEVRPGVCHIQDAMGVCFTLITGSERAMLFDAGYGTEDAGAFVRTLTDQPVTVLLSHGHHDHMLGARWFEETWIAAEDVPEFRERTGKFQRTKVMRQAKERGVPVPDDFMTAVIPEPKTIQFPEKTGPFESRREDLGGREIRVVHVPGHTPGSVVLYDPENDLLLTGDDWNPCTWMWFPTSVAAPVWRENMLQLIAALEAEYGREIRNVLCSHQPMLRTARELKGYLDSVTNEQLASGPEVDMGAPINTHEVRNVLRGWQLVYDYDKAMKEINA